MKPSGKTPYEIRLELLQLAREILHANYLALKDTGINPPTSQQIIDEAEKLNVFVSKVHTYKTQV